MIETRVGYATGDALLQIMEAELRRGYKETGELNYELLCKYDKIKWRYKNE